MLKMRRFLVNQEFSCKNFFKLSLGYFCKLFSVLFIAVNEVKSKHPQISRSLINFQENILILKEFQVPLK